MRKILLAIGLLFSCTKILPSYTVGALDTITNGGTGFGNATPGSALGYTAKPDVLYNIMANASAVQPDGKIVVVGATPTDVIIVRYNINGTLDTTFNSPDGFYLLELGISAIGSGVAIQTDGKIVVVGSVLIPGAHLFFVARFTAAGVLDGTGASANPFTSAGYITTNIGTLTDTTTIDTANAVAIDNSGNILVTGTSISATSGTSNLFVARYLSTGVLDTSFNNGAIVGGGNHSLSHVQTAQGIALIATSQSSGTLTNLTGNGIGLDYQGNIIVAGSSTTLGEQSIFAAKILNVPGSGSVGTLDFSFGSLPLGTIAFDVGGGGIAYGVGFQSAAYSHRIILVGQSSTNQNTITAGITTAGVLDTTNFGQLSTGYLANAFATGINIAQGVAVQENDTIVYGGTSTTNFLIARVFADGSSLDTSFNSLGYNLTNIVSPNIGNALSIQQNGSFILAGTVSSSTSEFGVARYLGENSVQGFLRHIHHVMVF